VDGGDDAEPVEDEERDREYVEEVPVDHRLPEAE
jgi:hypothetical protein